MILDQFPSPGVKCEAPFVARKQLLPGVWTRHRIKRVVLLSFFADSVAEGQKNQAEKQLLNLSVCRSSDFQRTTTQSNASRTFVSRRGTQDYRPRNHFAVAGIIRLLQEEDT